MAIDLSQYQKMLADACEREIVEAAKRPPIFASLKKAIGRVPIPHRNPSGTVTHQWLTMVDHGEVPHRLMLALAQRMRGEPWAVTVFVPDDLQDRTLVYARIPRGEDEEIGVGQVDPPNTAHGAIAWLDDARRPPVWFAALEDGAWRDMTVPHPQAGVDQRPILEVVGHEHRDRPRLGAHALRDGDLYVTTVDGRRVKIADALMEHPALTVGGEYVVQTWRAPALFADPTPAIFHLQADPSVPPGQVVVAPRVGGASGCFATARVTTKQPSYFPGADPEFDAAVISAWEKLQREGPTANVGTRRDGAGRLTHLWAGGKELGCWVPMTEVRTLWRDTLRARVDASAEARRQAERAKVLCEGDHPLDY